MRMPFSCTLCKLKLLCAGYLILFDIAISNTALSLEYLKTLQFFVSCKGTLIYNHAKIKFET